MPRAFRCGAFVISTQMSFDNLLKVSLLERNDQLNILVQAGEGEVKRSALVVLSLLKVRDSTSSALHVGISVSAGKSAEIGRASCRERV